MIYELMAMAVLLVPLGEWLFRDTSDRINVALAETFGPLVGVKADREGLLKVLRWTRWLNTGYFTTLGLAMLAFGFLR